MIGCASAAPQVTTYEWEQPLAKGAQAPYPGVLVPEDAYRYYQADSALYPSCREKLAAAAVPCPPPEPWFSLKSLIFLSLGFFAGVGAAR
jgi:hypothetical protein